MTKNRICIVGLGYIGLPTAAMFAAKGFKTIGVDIREEIVEALNKGKIVINEPGLDYLVEEAVASGNLVGRTRPEAAEVFIIAVPTPITEDKKADMSYVVSAAKSIVPYLKCGDAIILESTSPVGTVKNLICPILEESGLKTGTDLFVAYSPERVLPGQILKEIINNNRIIGGINGASSEKVRDYYRCFVKGEIFLTDSTTAEMCKIMENTYRDINIAFANELALICEKTGINVWDVIKLCNRHPRVNIHSPGPGVGGHCIPVDPWFILESCPETARIINTARKTNDYMPYHVLQTTRKILKHITGQKNITVLGITYKPDVDDIRESPIIHLIDLLKETGEFNIKVIDPYVRNYPNLEKDVAKAASGSDLLLLGVNHKEFKNINFKKIYKVMRNHNILDTRNFLEGDSLKAIGFDYFLIGAFNDYPELTVNISA